MHLTSALQSAKKMGDVARIEPATPCLQSRCSPSSATRPRGATIKLSTVYSEFFNYSNFDFRSIRSNNGFFGREFEAQAHFVGYLLAKLLIVPQLGIAVRHRLSRVAMPERDEVLGDRVLAKPSDTETAKCVTAHLRLFEDGQGRMQRAPQDVRLRELSARSSGEQETRLHLANEVL